MSIADEIKASFRQGSVLTRLIYLNLAVFILIQVVTIFSHLLGGSGFTQTLISYLAVPTNGMTLLTRPWTLVTYMFTHEGFFHILFNLLWLYWFGKILLSYLTEKQLLSIYLLGGFAGALLYIVSFNIFPGLKEQVQTSMAIGASASVMAIVMAIAFIEPNYRIYIILVGPVKILYVALIGFALSSLVDFSVNTGGKIAHIGGAMLGYYFAVQYNKGKDITMGFSRFLDKVFSWFKPGKKMRVTHKKKTSSDYEYNKQKVQKQKEVDRILDKISKKGYDSLTKEEKEILFKMGK
jgi:membrane associated rhomboid family serine protease